MNGSETKTVGGLVFEPGAIIAGRFEIRDRLGAGGVGMVYRALDRELDEVIALKLLLPHLAQDENVFRRFRNEVLVARTLSHPNIVRTHDMGKAEGGYSYISMEFVDGVSLKDKLLTRTETGEIRPSLAFEEALSILYQIISGVAYAHGKGVIHRDLKPANVLLSKSGEVKLADFGTARIMGMDTTLTQTGQVIGTPDYMSPEQIRGEQLDPSCDIYALGIVAYELATGHRPFVADSSVAVAFKHLNDPIPSISESGRIPLWFEEVVRKAAAKKKDERFASVMEFAATLLDYAPQLSVQSTFFAVDRTLFKSTGTQSGPAVGGTGSAALQPATPRHDGRFELGATSLPEDEGWRLGTTQQVNAASVPRREPVLDDDARPYPLKKIFGMGAAVMMALLVVAAVAARAVPGIDRSVSGPLRSLEASSPGIANFLAAVLGVPLEKEKVKVPPPVANEDERVREELARELGSEPSEAASSSTSSIAVVQPQSTPVPAETAELKAETSVKPDVKSETKTKVMPVEPPQPPPTPAPPLTFAGSLSFREGSRSLGDDSVSIDRLGQTRWTASLTASGGDGSPFTTEAAKGDFTLNIFDLRKAVVVTKLKPDQAQLPGRDDPTLRVSGTFGALRSQIPGPGSYRADLVRSGEVITSRDLVLYKASVSVSGGPSTSAGGSTVTIVTNSNLGGAAPQPTPAQIQPVEPVQPVQPVQPQPTPVLIQPTLGGLPVAKGHENDTPPPIEPALPPAEAESYSGLLRISPDGGPEERRALILNLEFRGVEIKGTANIAGYDTFSVNGRILARGMELELRNDTYWIRLTSGARGKSIRGLYTFPAVSKKGGWEATRTN